MLSDQTGVREQSSSPGGEAAGDAPGGDARAAETEEREAAIRRGLERATQRAHGHPPPRDPYIGVAEPQVAHRAFATLAENVRDYAIFLMNPDGVITFWGEGARLVKWWNTDQAEGAHLRFLYPDGGSEDGTAEEHLRMAAEAGEYTGEGHRVRGDGSTFWARVSLTALRAPDGALLGFAKVTRDLTARRAAEAARMATHDAAEEASRLKSLFLATISHEMRTPLNAVMAYTDIMEMELGGPLTSAQREQLGKIRASSQHLLGIINDVLDLSRVESGRLAVGRMRLRVGTVVAQALMLVEPQAAARNVELVDALAEFSADDHCWGDEERVRQILLNLLGNAVKFTEPRGRITISAGLAAAPPADALLPGRGPWLYVRIEDTGKGIPPDRIAAIFEPFVQADMNLTRQHGGTGLGLAISRHLARLMDGDLTARSEEGTGSTFFLWLPAAPMEAPAPTTAADKTTRLGSAGTLQDVREAILSELERILRSYVARLRSDPATPGADALTDAELEDHLASFVSDCAQTLGSLDLAAGAESEALRDGTAIQRLISERHGRQRARIGWTEAELEREFVVLKEELAAAVRRRVRRERQVEVEEAIDVLAAFVARAERTSLESFRLASGA